jgi:hypothetical protein
LHDRYRELMEEAGMRECGGGRVEAHSPRLKGSLLRKESDGRQRGDVEDLGIELVG